MSYFTTNMLHMGYRTLLLSVVLFYFTNPMDVQIQTQQDQLSHFFSWPENTRSRVQKRLISRSGDSILLTIPLEVETIEFYIDNHDFIRTQSRTKDRIYHTFSGKDSDQNAVFGYFLDGDVFLSFYRNGPVTEIAPEAGIDDLYHIRSSADQEAQGGIKCAVDELIQSETRRGGSSIPCQPQNYDTYTLRLFVACTGEWGQHHVNKKAAKQGALIFKAMF